MNKTVSTEKFVQWMEEQYLCDDGVFGLSFDEIVNALYYGNLSPDPDPDIKEVCDRVQHEIDLNEAMKSAIRMSTGDIDWSKDERWQFTSDLQALVNHARNTDNSELVEALQEVLKEYREMISDEFAESDIVWRMDSDVFRKAEAVLAKANK